MSTPREHAARDARTIQLLIRGDEAGLRNLLQDHGGVVLSYLRRKFGHALGEWQLEQTLAIAALRAWRTAPRLDVELGTLRAWFALIARNCGLAVLARQSGAAPVLDDFTPAPTGVATSFAELRRIQLVVDVHTAIGRLDDLERAVATADLEAGATVPPPLLAEQLGVDTCRVIAARSSARRALQQRLRELGHDDDERMAERLRRATKELDT